MRKKLILSLAIVGTILPYYFLVSFLIRYGPTRPFAINLIEGRLIDVIQFLDALSYGSGSTLGIIQNQTEWTRKVKMPETG